MLASAVDPIEEGAELLREHLVVVRAAEATLRAEVLERGPAVRARDVLVRVLPATALHDVEEHARHGGAAPEALFVRALLADVELPLHGSP